MRNVFKAIAAASVALALHGNVSAAATDLGTIGGTTTIAEATMAGSFDRLYTFSIGTNSAAGTVASAVQFIDIHGVQVTNTGLYAGAFSDVSQLAALTPISSRQTVTASPDGVITITSVVGNANLTANTPYTFWVSGQSLGNSGFTGIIALRPLDAVPAVPEPGSYAMLLAGLGMMGIIARRRQKQR